MKKIIIIVLIVVVLAAAAAVYFFVIAPKNTAEEPESTAVPENELIMYPPGEYFVTNIKDSKRLLKVSVVLGLTEEKALEGIEPMNPVIRNVILEVLREKDEAFCLDPNVMAPLSEEIRSKLTERLGVDYIQNIYFSDLCVQ